MSLINDALKKAQTLQPRSAGATATFPRPNTPAAGAGEPAGTLNPAATAPAPAAAELPPRNGASPHSALIFTIASVVLLAGVGAIGYVVYALFFMGTPEEQAIASSVPPPAVVKSAQAPAPSNAAPDSPADNQSSDETSAVAAAPAPTIAARSAQAPTSSPPAAAPVVSSTPAPVAPPETVPAVATVATETSSSVPAATPASPVEEEVEERINNPKPHIQAWVDKITVSGIRPGDRPKALMNDRVFVIGDVVNRELGLQLSKVSDRLLVFEDEEGNTYEYTF